MHKDLRSKVHGQLAFAKLYKSTEEAKVIIKREERGLYDCEDNENQQQH